MKALTVRQPFAWGIIFGQKGIENRSRPTSHRGPLVIHAGRSQAEFRGTTLRDWHRLFPGLPPFDQLPYGALIGVVEVVGCVRLEDRPDLRADPHAAGPFLWLLDDPRPLRRPVPWPGRLNLFAVPDPAVRTLLP
jgi:hypothetical protein